MCRRLPSLPSFLAPHDVFFLFLLLYWERKRNLYWWSSMDCERWENRSWDLGHLDCDPTVIHCMCSDRSFNAPSLCLSSVFSVQTLLFCGCFCWHYGVWSMLLDAIETNFLSMKKVFLFVFLFKWSLMMVRIEALESSPVFFSALLTHHWTVVVHLEFCNYWAVMAME